MRKKIGYLFIFIVMSLFCVTAFAEDQAIDVVGDWTGCGLTDSGVYNIFVLVYEDGTGRYYDDTDEELAAGNAFADMNWTLAGPALIINYGDKKATFLIDDSNEELSMINTDGLTVYKASDDSEDDENTEGESQDSSVKVNKEDFVGDWYEVGTFAKLSLSANGEGKLVTSYSSWINWEPGVDQLVVNGGDLSALNVVNNEDVISLVDNENEFVRLEDIPSTELKEGSVESDNAISISYEGYEFYDELPEEMVKFFSSRGKEYGEETALQDGETYLAITFTLENLSKNKIIVGDYQHLLETYVDYNNGFVFSTYADSYDTPYTYYTDGDNICAASSAWLGDEIGLQPLTKRTITVFIRCASAISENDGPLSALFISHFDTSMQYYKAVLRE